MSDNEFLTTTAPQMPLQTSENTTAPFEPSPVITTIVPPPKPKRKRIRLTPKQRAAKIAAGWNPPGPQPKSVAQNDQNILNSMHGDQKGSTKADEVLNALVLKLVALENDAQYRSVWLHFFTHGGVFSGPKYADELAAAIQYLNGK